MKRLKTVLVVILLIILTVVLLTREVNSYENGSTWSFSDMAAECRWIGQTTREHFWTIVFGTIEKTNNIYCVEYNQQVPESNYRRCSNNHATCDYFGDYCPYCGQMGALRNIWYYTSKVVISDTTTTFYYVDHYGNETQKGSRTKTPIDNQLAAIINKGTGMYVDTTKTYTTSQEALYHIWNDWVNQGCYTSGFKAYSDNPSNSSSFNILTSDCNTTNYKATIYYFEPAYVSNFQNLILGEPDGDSSIPPPVPEPEEIDVTVTKVWRNDSNNEYNTRSNVTIQLKADGVVVDSTTLGPSNWSYTFQDLPADVTYTVSETTSLPGYTTSISGNAEIGFTITNTLKTTELTVNKIWDDDSNRDGIRPSTITVNLYANGTKIRSQSITGTGDNWSYTFTNLPLYYNGSYAQYTVDEVVPTGYTATQ